MFLGWVLIKQEENLEFSLMLVHHYQPSDFMKNYGRVRSGVDHRDRAHAAKPYFENLIGKIANQVVGRVTHCHV